MSVLKAVVFKITTDKSPLEMNASLELTYFNCYHARFRVLNAPKCIYFSAQVEQQVEWAIYMGPGSGSVQKCGKLLEDWTHWSYRTYRFVWIQVNCIPLWSFNLHFQVSFKKLDLLHILRVQSYLPNLISDHPSVNSPSRMACLGRPQRLARIPS